MRYHHDTRRRETCQVPCVLWRKTAEENMRCLQRRPIRTQKEGGNREKAWSVLQGNTKKGKKQKPLQQGLLTKNLAPPAGFEPVACRLGEPLNICHLCSPMYRKVAIRQVFFVFRVAPCSSKFTDVVRCSPVHFSSFLDFSKKGNKDIFYLPPILAHFRVKIHLQSNRKPKQNISHLPEMYSLGKMIKKRVLHSRFE